MVNSEERPTSAPGDSGYAADGMHSAWYNCRIIAKESR